VVTEWTFADVHPRSAPQSEEYRGVTHPTSPPLEGRQRLALFRHGVALTLIALMSGLISTETVTASSVTPPPPDVSSAVRYNNGKVIGQVIVPFINVDDAVTTVELPFPINFFGVTSPALCISTNGVVYPVTTQQSTCLAKFNRDLETLTALSGASSIAPLGADLDPGYHIRNPHRADFDELEVEEIHVAADAELTTTITTKEPHGFVVGDQIRIDGTQRPDNLNVTRVSRVVSNTQFEALFDNTFFTPTPGTTTNDNDSRLVVSRARLSWFLNTGSTISIVDNTLEIDILSNPPGGPGRKMTLVNTGIPALDNADLTIISRSGTTFVTNLPPGLTDVDPTQDGDQTTVAVPDRTVWFLERDDVGAIQQVYVGNTTVDGRPALAVTWYRMANNITSVDGWPSPINPPTLTTTAQLVLIQRGTGSDETGWDIDFEFNFGHVRDTAEGYLVDEPVRRCSTSDLTKCRWAIGVGKFVPGVSVSAVAQSGLTVTVSTATPHGIAIGEMFNPVGLSGAPFYLSDPLPVASIIDDQSFTVQVGFPDDIAETATPNALMGRATSYELFPQTPVPDLGDLAGPTALISNSLNSAVLGRYRFFMIDGEVTGFIQPSMGTGVAWAPGFAPPTPNPVSSPPLTSPVPEVSEVPEVPGVSEPTPIPDPDGALPRLEPGGATFSEDGRPVAVTITVQDERKLELSGEGFRLGVAGECDQLDCRIADSDGRPTLILETAGSVAVDGFGFAPDSLVHVWLFSTPRYLGSTVVRSDGTFASSLPLGDVAPGEHTLQVNGTSADGAARSANLGVLVTVAVTAGELPATGGHLPLGFAMALAVLGSVVVLLSRGRLLNKLGRP
jgi:hypothetical protein